jgi:hypothetical protein
MAGFAWSLANCTAVKTRMQHGRYDSLILYRPYAIAFTRSSSNIPPGPCVLRKRAKSSVKKNQFHEGYAYPFDFMRRAAECLFWQKTKQTAVTLPCSSDQRS